MSVGSATSGQTYIVTASYDKQVRMWDAATGRTVRTFTFQDSQVNQIHIMPVTRHLAVAGFGVIRLYDTSSFTGSAGGMDSLVASGGATGAHGASGSNSAAAAPPLIASFESQSTMNITSVGGIPLQPLKRHEEDHLDDKGDGEYGGALNESASGLGGTCVLNDFGLATMQTSYGANDPRGPYAPGLAIYATSEDGHVRFFDGRSTNTLHMVKDIATGAAITCSAISPDRRFLLTGNQMGIVSVWHLPSVIASAAEGYSHRTRESTKAPTTAAVKPEAESHVDPTDDAAAATTEDPAAPSLTKESTDKETMKKKKKKKLSYEPQAGPFGSQPLQEITFGKDYSAIRSIACDPTGHWFVIATNAGKLHLLRFANDSKMGGSRTRVGSGEAALFRTGDADGSGTTTTGTMHERSENGAAGGSRDSRRVGGGEDRYSGAPSVSSRLDFGGNGSAKSSEAAAAGARGRESIYRSALVVNELSSNARRRTSSGGSSPAGKDSAFAAPAALLQHDGSVLDAQSTAGSTMGAVLLNSLEQQRSHNSVAAAAAAATVTNATDGLVSPLSVAVDQRDPVQEETELEVFHSVQAHYKYILRVAISPDGGLIITCSADYTLGRYLVPTFMQSEALSRQDEAGSGAHSRLGRRSPQSASVLDAHTSNVSITSTQAPGCEGRLPTGSASASSSVAALALGHDVSRVSAMASAETAGPQDEIGAGDGPLGSPSGKTQRAGSDVADSATGAPLEPTFSSRASTTTAVAMGANPSGGAGGADKAQGGQSRAGAHTSSSLNSTVGAAGEMGGEDSGTHSLFESNAIAADMLQLNALKPLTGHNRWVWDCAFSECGEYLFSASSDNHVRMWNGIATERAQSTAFVGHTKPVVSVVLFAEPKIAPRV